LGCENDRGALVSAVGLVALTFHHGNLGLIPKPRYDPQRTIHQEDDHYGLRSRKGEKMLSFCGKVFVTSNYSLSFESRELKFFM